MQNKRYLIAGVFIAFVVILFAVLAFITINDIQTETAAFNTLVSEWSDNGSNAVTMRFTDSGEVNIAGASAGTFSIDPKNQQITIFYNKLNGNKAQTYRYNINGDTLTMTDKDSGESVTYTKKTN